MNWWNNIFSKKYMNWDEYKVMIDKIDHKKFQNNVREETLGHKNMSS